ncbi:MAG: glycosyl hydrolase [Luteolibacter sp.]
MHRDITLMLAASLLALAAPLHAGTIQLGNVTNLLGPTFFIDEATNGGVDTDLHQDGTNKTAFLLRSFNGLLTPNHGPSRLVLTGFGFALHTSATANDATSVAVAFTYLGADEVVGGSDDVVIGTATGTLNFTAGGEYTFAFANPLTANLNVTGTRFRITITPTNLAGTGSLKIKSADPSYAPYVSVAGVASSTIAPQRVNLAKYQTVTATSVAGARLASYATDGDAGNDSRWQSQNWAFNNARIDFPFPVEVGSAQVFMGFDDTLPLGQFVVQRLEGSTWTTISGASVVGNTNVERNLVFPAPVTATSFRISVTDPTIRLREFALYPPNGANGYPLGTDVNLNLAYQRPAVASSFTTGAFPLNAVDGRTHVGSAWRTTTVGVNTLDVEMVAATKVGSVHLYSGLSAASPLADFTLKYWSGSAWLNFAGGVVTGNTSADRVITFTTPVSTTQVRLEFTKTGTTPTVIRELQVFPANTGNVGYPLGTNINSSGAYASYEVFNDAFYQIVSPASANRTIAVATGGQPALDQAGITTAQEQYQILLNQSNGTYRLRNRDTGNCLSGAQLSKTPGAVLADAPYLAMPHQDWILEPLGGGIYQIVNAWSGLVVDTQGGATAAGTALIQNTASSATTQRWHFFKDIWAPKKGVGGSNFAAPLKADWIYNWGPTNSVALPVDTVYQPMQWGSFNWVYGTGSGPIWQHTSAWRKRGDGLILLGFNEPDREDQSNITLQDCVALWPRVMALDQPLLSPSPGTLNPPAGPSWHEQFYDEVDRLGYRVEYNAIHAYPSPNGGSSDGLINLVQSEFNDFGLPVWLTEFSFVDWAGTASWSEEDSYQTLAEFLWRAEDLTALRKFALFVFSESSAYPQPPNSYTNYTPAPRSNSYDIAGNLTAFGKLYAGWDNDTTVRADKTYLIHNRELRKRMANAATTNTTPGGRTIRTDGPIVNWTLVSTGVSNRYHVVSSIDGRRLSHTTGTGVTPTLAAAGTTGVNVEWSLTATTHGWHYLGHPASGTRLRLASFNTGNNVANYQMVPTTTTDNNTQWRFIVPLESNSAPVFTSIPDQVVNELTAVSFTASATDATLPAGPITYSLIDPLFNSSINATTGAYTWTPTETQGDGTTYAVRIRASDGQLATEQVVNITVNEVNSQPNLSSISNKTVNEGAQLTFTASATDADLPANTLTYSLINAPEGASIVGSTGVFTWTPTETQGPDSFTFTVRVSDGVSSHDRSVSVTVGEVGTAPVLDVIPPQTVDEGVLLNFTASATDVDLPAGILSYSLIGAPLGAAIHSASGSFTWTPTTEQGPGNFIFTVQVSDGSLTDDQLVSVTVESALPSPEIDTDGDGLSDLLEFAFATNPTLPNKNPFRVNGVNTGTIILEFPWNWQASGLSWKIRHGQELANRTAWPVVSAGTTTTVREGNVDRITVTPAMDHPGHGFFVLEVTGN